MMARGAVVRAALCLLLLLLGLVMAAEGTDITGTWESRYQIGPVGEVMTTTIQQIGDQLIGSFLVKPLAGSERSGILFGTVDGDRVLVHLLSARDGGRDRPLLTQTFMDGKVADENTLKGSFYVSDSDGLALSGSFEAIRK